MRTRRVKTLLTDTSVCGRKAGTWNADFVWPLPGRMAFLTGEDVDNGRVKNPSYPAIFVRAWYGYCNNLGLIPMPVTARRRAAFAGGDCPMNDGTKQPMATYRLQLNRDFRFTDAQALALYFSRLGVTHLYASPMFRPRQGSTHGYDVVDPKTINPELGDKTDLIHLVTDLKNLSLGLVLDIVPNHTAASIENPYWRDILTYGHSSPFAGWFDIDWRMPDPDMWGRVLLPILGQPRSHVVADDQIRVSWSEGRFVLNYFDHVLPVGPASVAQICEFGLQELSDELPEDNSAVDRIREVLDRLKQLPSLAARLRRRVDIDRDETEQWLSHLAQLVVQSPRTERWAEETARRFSEGEEGRRRLKKLLDAQPYRLVYWRAAARTINYRRFFDINELISIRQEDPNVFDETHETPLRWIEDGLVDGLRIDHIDGLRDPLGYLERLSQRLEHGEARERRIPIFVEKILAPNEHLPCGWPVAGTTGYDFLNEIESIFVAREGFAAIEKQYRRMLRRPVHFHRVATWGKRRVLREDLSPQVGRLADTLLRLTENPPQPASATTGPESVGGSPSDRDATDSKTAASAATHDLTKGDFAEAIVEVVTALPVYRTYVNSHDSTVSDADRHYVEIALHEAHRHGRATPEAIDFLGDVLLLRHREQLSDPELHERVNFVERFQQLSGPAAAKGIEDTALYAYVPLVSLNEVGGEPVLPEDSVARLHRANQERATTWPRAMLGVTTHDTKRNADVRARLDVLSEFPKFWSGLVERWQRLNKPLTTRVRGKRVPDAATEYLFYQTVVGIWPTPDPHQPERLPATEVIAELAERVQEYMLKAVREAKTHTTWTKTNQPYEDGVSDFVSSLLNGSEDKDTPFLDDVQNLLVRIARPGFWNSLSRTLVQMTSPGTPDLYQGDELWNFCLVDPDNRRPVDYTARKKLLDEVITNMESRDECRRAFVRDLVASAEDGRIKLLVIRGALAARTNFPALFDGGSYRSLPSSGSASEHVIAYARLPQPRSSDEPGHHGSERAAIVVVPRLTVSLVSSESAAPVGETVWTDTKVELPEELAGRNWTCVLTGKPVRLDDPRSIPISGALEEFPAALLISES